MLKKKAQGLSITTIIVAVIGLIILVVIVMMITGKLGIFSEGVGRAVSCDNLCKASGYGAEGNNPHSELKGPDNIVCNCEK